MHLCYNLGMLIGIDCRLWRQTGVGRYTQNLVNNLYDLDKTNKYVLFVLKEDYEELSKLFLSENWKIVKTNVKWHSIAEQTKFAFFLNSFKLDLMHFPYFSVPYLYRRKFIVTVHDLIINKFNTGQASTLPYPVYLSKRLAYNVVLTNAVNKAYKIIVPSNVVKNDILEVYKKVKPEKIEITYEGGFEDKQKVEENKHGEYLLRIGNFYPHKNIGNLLLGFKNLNNKQIKLLLVGKKDYFFARVEKEINQLDLKDRIIFIENPNDSKLYSLYANARAVIVPSFMEGFSLTSVEAMGLGVPLAVSDIAVHREICKDGAVYFDPNNPEDIKDKINALLDLDKESLDKIKKLEIDVSKSYSWEKMAAQTLSIYKSISSK